MKRHNCFVAAAAGLLLATSYSLVQAAPYASGITVTGGTAVSYIMNEDSDVLEISINGGAYTGATDGTAKGPHSFTIPSGATFSIRADRTEVGFTTPTGGTQARVALGTSTAYDTPEFTGLPVNDLTSLLSKFNSPRGVAVSNDPNAPNFGAVYVSNSNAGATGGRTLTGRGLFVMNADQTQGYSTIITDSNAAQQSALFGTTSTNSPYKLTVGQGGDVFVAGFGDGLSGVWRMSPDLQTNPQVFAGTTGPTALPSGQNHGSVTATVVEGSVATSDLVVYTLDEDLSTLQVTGSGSGVDTNKLWKYTVGGTASGYATMPTPVASPLISGFSIVTDVDRGPDGKFYLSQNRSTPANSTGFYVTDASGNVLFDSRLGTAKVAKYSTPAGDFNHDGTMNAADYVMWRKGTADADANGDTIVDAADYGVWRTGNGAASANFRELGFGDIVNDMYANIFALAVSPDGKWLATLHNATTIAVTPLVNGIPDIANMMSLGIGGQVITARDIAWDAAGNLHMVSSGTGQYYVLAPGGHTIATTSWNGTTYAFNLTTQGSCAGSVGGGTVPEPGTLVLLLTGVMALGFGRRRR